MMPRASAMMANFLALAADSIAPAWSPPFHLPLTCAAKTTAGMPIGQQHRRLMMARIRLLPGGGPAGGPP
jgi:hypothetical protein